MTVARTAVLSKVPEVTLGFWVIKILATISARLAATRSQ